MLKKHDEEFIDSAIRLAGYKSLEKTGAELPQKDEAIAFLMDASDLDQRMEKVFNRERAKRRIRKASIVSLRIAIVVLVLIVVSTIAVMSSEALRVKFLNFFISSNEEYTEIAFSDEKPEIIEGMIVPEYIPEGFELVETVEMEGFFVSTYTNQQEAKFRIEQFEESVEQTVDNERYTAEEIEVDGKIMHYFEEEIRKILILQTDAYVFTIFGNITKEEMIKIAQSIGN